MTRSKTKTVSYIYSPYQIKSLEKYLDKMALKGWLLKHVEADKLTFKKTTAVNIKYSVDILDKIPIFETESTEILLDYIDLCKYSGWEYICRSGKILFFYSEETNYFPIHTDEYEKFTIIKKASIKNYISIVLLITLLLFIALSSILYPSGWSILCSNIIFLPIVLIAYCLIKAILLVKWCVDSKKRLNLNECPNYEVHEILFFQDIFPNYIIPRILGVLSQLLIVILIFLAMISRNQSQLYFTLMLLFCTNPYYNIILKIKDNIKEKNTLSVLFNMTIAIITIISLLFISTKVVRPEMLSFIASKNKAIEKPLSLNDFNDTPVENHTLTEDNIFLPRLNFKKSIFTQCYDIKEKGTSVDLSYTLLTSNIPMIINYYGNKLVSNEALRVPLYDNAYVIPEVFYEKISTSLPANITVYSRQGINFIEYVLKDEKNLFNITFYETPYDEDKNLEIIYNTIFKNN